MVAAGVERLSIVSRTLSAMPSIFYTAASNYRLAQRQQQQQQRQKYNKDNDQKVKKMNNNDKKKTKSTTTATTYIIQPKQKLQCFLSLILDFSSRPHSVSFLGESLGQAGSASFQVS